MSAGGATAAVLSCANPGCHGTGTKDRGRAIQGRAPGASAGRDDSHDPDTCGQGSTGCHTEKNTYNHGGKHELNLAGSNYVNATISGCMDAGAGCHEPTEGSNDSTNVASYHPNSGCAEGPCHTECEQDQQAPAVHLPGLPQRHLHQRGSIRSA